MEAEDIHEDFCKIKSYLTSVITQKIENSLVADKIKDEHLACL